MFFVEKPPVEIVEKAKEKNVTSGRGPQGIAAAAIYIAAIKHQHPIPLRRISEVAKVTEVTIKNRYREIIEALGIENEIEKLRINMENKYGIEQT